MSLQYSENYNKLDGLGPVNNRPSTNKLHHFVKKKCDMWQVTCDTWNVTRDMWHVTCGMLWGVNIVSKFQLLSYSGLWFMIFWRLGGKGWFTNSLNESMNDKADCRTAPATPGLVKIISISGSEKLWIWEKIVIVTKAQQTTLTESYEYPATISWFLQPHHGSCSNIMSPVVTYWLL